MWHAVQWWGWIGKGKGSGHSYCGMQCSGGAGLVKVKVVATVIVACSAVVGLALGKGKGSGHSYCGMQCSGGAGSW